jgi:hypothetical protein
MVEAGDETRSRFGSMLESIVALLDTTVGVGGILSVVTEGRFVLM